MIISVNLGAQVVDENPQKLSAIDIVEHLGDTIPLDLEFVDDSGKAVVLHDYFRDGRPVILIMGYYTCPMLCNLVFNGVSEAVDQLDLKPSEDFQILSISIDTTEIYEVAGAKKANYLKNMKRQILPDGWFFLTDPYNNSKKLAEAIGFQYYYDTDTEQFAHPAVITILSAEGKISRYLYGIEFKPNDLRLAVKEAAEGKIVSTVDKIILYCYQYDPEAGSYVVLAGNVMKLGGLLVFILFIFFLAVMWIKDYRRKAFRINEL
ncbi:MAG: SCO family protein [Candidatus Zixiibacteriota bacterium]